MATKTRSSIKTTIVEAETTGRNSGKMKQPSHLSSLVMLSQQLLSIGRFNKDLPSLISKGVDSEQLWQQIDLRNNHQLALSKCTREVVQISNRKRVKREKKVEKEIVSKGSSKAEDDSGSSSDSDVDDALDAIKKRLADKPNGDDGLFDFGDSDDADEDGNDFDFDVGKSRGLFDDGDQEDEDKEDSKPKRLLPKPRKKSTKKPSAVDDKFFKMADMEDFLDSEDLKEEKKMKTAGKSKKSKKEDESSDEEDDDEDIDMFADDESEDGDVGATAKYTDFFDPPDDEDDGSGEENQDDGEEDHEDVAMDVDAEDEEDDVDAEDEEDDGVKEEEDDDDDDDEEESTTKKPKKKVSFSKELLGSDEDEKPDVDELGKTENKSSFQQKQEKLLEKAREMEELSLQAPSWELTGEVMSSKRPQNSLLEAVMDFQHTTRPAPVITDETTKTLEDYIKQRIKDKTFDDVERKEKPKEDVFEFKKRVVLDQEKSKQSLAEIYEQEFVKQQKKDSDEVKADPQCEKIEKDLNKLFYQLDALSNFRYTPMKPGTEVRIVVNTPAISMEEVAPVATTDADLLAPEEVMAKGRGDLKTKEEMDATDRKRARRQKKAEKREKKRAKESREKKVEKLKPGLGNKYSKAKALKTLEELSKSDKNVHLIKGEGKTSLASSKSFFSQLQDEVTTQAKSIKAVAKKKEKKRKDAGGLIL